MNPEISLPPSRALYRGDREVDNIQARKKRKRGEEEKGKVIATGALPSGPQQDTAMQMVGVRLFKTTINHDNQREQCVTLGAKDPAPAPSE